MFIDIPIVLWGNLMATSISSVTQRGTSEPFELQVARGQIALHEPLFKYGYNPLIINVEETIWDVGGSYSFIATAAPLVVTSASGATDAGVTGVVQGLDSNYNEISEAFTLNGSGTYTTELSFYRAHRAYITGASEPAGNINFTIGATTYARITAGENQTLMAVYTVPAGKTLYVGANTATHGTDTSGAFITVRFKVRNEGSVFRTATKIDMIGGEILFPYQFPLKVPEKSDIQFTAICNKNQNNAIAATIDGVLIKEGGSLE